MEKLIVFITALFVTACVTGAPVSDTPCCVPPPAAVPAAKSLKKNYLVWNKKQFYKPKGLVTMSKSTILALADKFGAENMKPLQDVNGFTVKNVPAASALSFTSDEWVVQEEVEYHALETLYRLTPVETNPTTPCPTCPNPTPTPCPTPTPTPGPVEVAKSWGISAIHAEIAKTKVDTSGVRVCVVDTGFDQNHPDAPKLLESASFTGEPISPDVGKHGSHVSGTIAGRRGSGIGVSEAGIGFFKGLNNSGSGSTSQLVQAGSRCRGYDIASFSWGADQPDQAINAMIQSLVASGTWVVIANGNNGSATLGWPAGLSITIENVLGIASMSQNGRRSSYSQYGNGTKYILPGENITSNSAGTNGTMVMSGTSMATPHMAGVLAYCRALKIPTIQACVKTVMLSGVTAAEQGRGMPDLKLIVGF